MAYTQFTKDMNIITPLNDRPNALGNPPDNQKLSAADLKGKFDEGGLAIKNYINNTLLPELNQTASDLTTDEGNISQNTSDITALKAKMRFLYADDNISYDNITSTTIMKAKVHPDGEVGAYIIGKNGGVARIIASMDSARWIISTQQMQLKPTGYASGDVAYSSESGVYDQPPVTVGEALGGLETVATGLNSKRKLAYYDGEIDTTVSYNVDQTGYASYFFPDVEDGDYFVDKNGYIGRVRSVSSTTVTFRNMLQTSLIPVNPTFETATLAQQTGDGVVMVGGFTGDNNDEPMLLLKGTDDGESPVRINGVASPVNGYDAANKAYVDAEVDTLEAYNTANYRLSYTIRNVLSTNFIPKSTIVTGKTKVGDILVDPSGNLARATSEATVGGVNGWQIMALGNRIAEAPENIAPIYSSSETYDIGDYVHYAGALYCCNTTISTAEAWTSEHWAAVVLADDIPKVDSTLIVANAAADAKATGDKIGELKRQINSLCVDTTFTGWELGAFNSTNGSNFSASTRIRNQKTFGLSTGAERIVVESGFSALLFAWNTSGTYIGSYKVGGNFDKTASNYQYVNEFDLSAFPNYVVKVSLKNNTSDTISASDGSKCHFYMATDKTLSEENKAADAKATGDKFAEVQTEIEDFVEIEQINPINLLNLNDSDFSTGTKLSATYGTPTTANNSFTTGFIPVEEGKTYNWIYGTSISTSQVISRICAYGSDKSYKSSYTQDNQRGFTVPSGSGIAYVRFSGNTSHLPPTEINVMFAAGFPDRYYSYFAPYTQYTVKDTAMDDDYIRELGGMEQVFPEWELGSYNNSWNFTDSTTTIMSDYIPVGDHLKITVAEGYTAKIYPFYLTGQRGATYPITVTSETVISKANASRFVQITLVKTTEETVTDPNTYGLNVTIVRYGEQVVFDTRMSANPNVQDVVPSEVLPQYLALVAVKEKNVSGELPVTVGYLYRTVTSPYKLYYAQGKPENIKYLCDWDSSIAGASNNTPIWFCFGITDEGDIICVHRGEIESSSSPRIRDDPIVYPHTDYAHPVLVELTGAKPTSWISNSGSYAESGHFFFGEYIRSGHTEANVWDVSAPYTSASDWQIIKTYERDSDPSNPSSMVLGKIEHIHHVSRDPFSGVLYVTTGDHYTEARIDYLKNGTWGVLAEGDEEVCRQLNFVYTPTYVYWGSDAFATYDPETQQMVGGAHKFFRAKRDANGLIDLDNLDSYPIPYLTASVATYHVAYVKHPECILILDRQDDARAFTELPFHVWNIKEERLEYASQCKTSRGSVDQYLGFRCECCQHYPNLYDSVISVGFSLYPNSIDVCGNPNPAIIPSQGGVTANDNVNANQVNSMTIEVVKH